MASSLGDGPTSTQPVPPSASFPDQPVPEIRTHPFQPASAGQSIQNTSIAEKLVTPNLERLLAKCKENELKERGSSSSFIEKCQDLLAAWTFILNEKVISPQVIQTCQTTSQQNLPPEYRDLKAHIKQLLRLHQKHVIDEQWTESPEHLKTGLFEKITQAEPLFGLPNDPAPAIVGPDRKPLVVVGDLAKELAYLKSIHANAWKGQILKAILTASTDFKSAEYFQLEAPDLCLKRLAVLVGTKLYLPAFNLASYCVKKSGLEGGAAPSVNRISSNWILGPETKTELVEILDVYIGLLFKMKRDTLLYLPMLKNFAAGDVLDLIGRFQQREASLSNIEQAGAFKTNLWGKPEGKKVSGATAAANAAIDFLMVLAAKRPLPEPELAKIVSLWAEKCESLKDGTIEDFVANLEIEVEKYAALEGLSNHLYEMGVQIYRKHGKNSQQLALDTMLRGFHFDLNRREVAIHKQDVDVLKKVEDNLALGMQKLALVFDNHLAAKRECVLTAFSLTPTQALMQEIESLARASGFVEEATTAPNGEDTNNPAGTTHTEGGAWTRTDNFEAACADFTASLEAKKYSRAYCGPIKERQVRNLDALLAIEGNLITEAANYNPVSAPFPSFSSAAMGGHLSDRTLGDVLTCISSPRWHLLSWVLDWATLQDRCSALLKDPEMRIPGGIKRELKYLVIDYTQFEEWSSDEEILAQSGIEKGYEAWEDENYVEPTHVEERGLGDDEEFDFNVIPKLMDDEDSQDDDGDLYIYPEEYLPNHSKTQKSKKKSKTAKR